MEQANPVLREMERVSPLAEKAVEEKIEPKTNKAEELLSLAHYNRELLKHLPKGFLKREPRRIFWSFFFASVSIAIVACSFMVELPFYAQAGLGILLGAMNAGGAFIGHEILHGSVVKNRKLQNFFGFWSFAPFLISPTYWRFWHNRLHHGNTQLLYKDPDAFPTKLVWKKSSFMKRVFPFTPGSGHKRSYLYFFWWFSFQAVLNQVSMRFGNKMWEKMDHKKVSFEFALQSLLLIGYLAAVGISNWWWLALIPFMVQNYTVMSYISTNHNLSPYTRINDPLANSLSVTNHPVLEFFHLNFGYHTEHHLYPNMPMSRAKKVSAKLKEIYPDRYMIMPKTKALKLLYSTPRIYKNRETLVNPLTGKEFPTIKPETDPRN